VVLNWNQELLHFAGI